MTFKSLGMTVVIVLAVYMYLTESDKHRESTQSEAVEPHAVSDTVNGNSSETQMLSPQKEKTAPSSTATVDTPEQRSFGRVNVEEIYNIPAPKGVLSIYPEKPDKIYLAALKSARQGDDKMQYQLAKALRECTGVPDEKRIAQLDHENYLYLDDTLRSKLHQDANYCKALFELVDVDSIEAEYNKWYDKALSNGNEMAMANHWFEHSENFSRDEAKMILERALYYSDNDIYHYISKYYATYFADHLLEEIAWDVIHCQRIEGCESKILKAYYDEQLNHYEQEDLTGMLNRIDIDLEKKANRVLN